MAVVYKSKVDTWLMIVLIAAIAIAIFVTITVVLAGPRSTWWLLAITLGVGVALPAWVLWATDYTLTADQLLVRSGPFKWRIPVESISAVSPTLNALSSPALSLDRLRVEYGKGSYIMISPRDKDAFLRSLEAARATLRRGSH